jgi:hypothetical protein
MFGRQRNLRLLASLVMRSSVTGGWASAIVVSPICGLSCVLCDEKVMSRVARREWCIDCLKETIFDWAYWNETLSDVFPHVTSCDASLREHGTIRSSIVVLCVLSRDN